MKYLPIFQELFEFDSIVFYANRINPCNINWDKDEWQQ